MGFNSYIDAVSSHNHTGAVGDGGQLTGTSEITLASGEGIQFSNGAGGILVRCQSGIDYLNIRDTADSAWKGFQAKDAYMNGNIDMGAMGNGLTVDNVRVNLNWILGV